LRNRENPAILSKTRFKLMKHSKLRACLKSSAQGFTLVEMLVVIAIMSILMTAGAIGLGNMGGKGVTSGVASAESMFEEARSIAVGQRTKTRVLISKDLTNNPADNLRRILIVSAELDPTTGLAKTPQNWILSSRGVTLPDQTYFSQNFSRKVQDSAGAIETMNLTSSATVKASYVGTYYFYEFNAEGIYAYGEKDPSTFVIGSGVRKANATANDKPKVAASGKRDFGGFVVWRNGWVSMFRSPDQMDSAITSIKPGQEF
jgi:prepilin-type N-terminal cleavage/methylation domain-containing protein